MHGGAPGLLLAPKGSANCSNDRPCRPDMDDDDVIAEGDKVVVRATKHLRQESFLGIPAAVSGRTFTATFIHGLPTRRLLRPWRNR